MREVTDYALNRKAIRHYMVEHDMKMDVSELVVKADE
nr:MAG: hypothetical protein [Bacteriophage sp.]